MLSSGGYLKLDAWSDLDNHLSALKPKGATRVLSLRAQVWRDQPGGLPASKYKLEMKPSITRRVPVSCNCFAHTSGDLHTEIIDNHLGTAGVPTHTRDPSYPCQLQ